MKISFNINYRTHWGEALFIIGNIPELGEWDHNRALQMNLDGAEKWNIELDLPDSLEKLEYKYIVRYGYNTVRQEVGDNHSLCLRKDIRLYTLADRWQDTPSDKPWYSSAFVNGMLRRVSPDQPLLPAAGSITLRINAPMIAPDEFLALAGDGETLGNWDVHLAPRMNDANYPTWEVNIPTANLHLPLQFKPVILKKETREIVAWENRNNRTLTIKPGYPTEAVVFTESEFANPKGPWKGAGTAIPVFSIRSEEDFGVGDFLDIKLMVDWCRKTGQKVLQLLPINDTTMTGTWQDSYPYNANSTFALHPMYLRPEAAGVLKDTARRDYYRQAALELNQLDVVDYEKVNRLKNEYMHELYAQKAASTAREKAYKLFVASNEEWLKPYAAFCLLRDLHGTAEFDNWGDMAVYNREKVDDLCAKRHKEINYYYFVQYHLDKQLREAREYAHRNGVVLKGDIPIGISRNSVDAWVYPHLFYMNCQAGAPPDDFSVLGQNWGFPTYNWEEMSKDGFSWWKARFCKMAEYFDAYRIDHILGFFRIWQIPDDAVHGLLGVFHPALPFTPEEMRNSFDFWINTDFQTKPFAIEWALSDFFGEYTNEAKERFLSHVEGDRYRLKEFVDTQKKVEKYFATQEQTEANKRMRDGLLGLIDDVLFIEDPYEKGKYHPRISAQFTYQYRALNDYERWCFNRMYNDFFYHRHNDFWYGKAMWKLPPLIDSTKMLCCAEDLGMIPDCVPTVMSKLQILSLEIQRMPKDPAMEFGNTWSYPYCSICTTSTHDMPGIRAWWESERDMAQRYYNQVLHEGGEAPFYAEPWICSRILQLHLNSPSMLCILPLQDWLSMDGTIRRKDPKDEQINIPAISRHYWRYRMHLTVENLMKKDAFNDEVSRLIQDSGR